MTEQVLYTHHEKLDSSAITEVWYDTYNMGLYIRFKSSGQIAGYSGVGFNTFNDLMETDSAGRYYSQWIKGRYQGLNGDVEFVSRNPDPELFDFEVEFVVSGKTTLKASSVIEALETFINENNTPGLNVKVKAVKQVD